MNDMQHKLYTADACAVFDVTRTYRYVLRRNVLVPLHRCERKEPLVFLMLNPSTADETQNDPTVRRCIGYAEAWGHPRLTVLNIFALRSTNPEALYDHPDPIGPENDQHILRECLGARVICAWGNHGKLNSRAADVCAMLDRHYVRLYSLAVTKEGEPGHPLYLRRSATPTLYNRRPS